MTKPAVGDRKDRSAAVQQMFSSIAPRYDLLNRSLSMGVDQIWRQQATAEALAKAPRRILDVATGTGDFALQLARQAPTAEVRGEDFVPEMLAIAREKSQKNGVNVHWAEADALNMPHEDESFDALTCAFGFRNFSDYQAGLNEMSRVLAKGGRLVILEFPPPSDNLFGRAYRLYFEGVLPKIGGLVSGNAEAYSYLPASVLAFPQPEELLKMMRVAGLSGRYRSLSGGIAGLWVAEKL